jgi:hypothetical protein
MYEDDGFARDEIRLKHMQKPPPKGILRHVAAWNTLTRSINEELRGFEKISL